MCPMPIKAVVISREMLEGVLEYARESHPNEILLLIRAYVRDETVIVKELLFPPFEVQGPYYVYFNSTALPPYTDILGSIHSHPSGSLKPSSEDLIHGFGPVIIIVAYPYDARSVAAYNKGGRPLKLVIS